MMSFQVWMDKTFIMTVFAEWLSCIVYILLNPKRIAKKYLAGYGAAMLAAIFGLVYVTTVKESLFWNMGWMFFRVFLYVILMGLCIYGACRISARKAVYLCMQAFLLAELAWSVYWKTIYSNNSEFFEAWGRVIPGFRLWMMFLVYALVFAIAWTVERYFQRQVDEFEVTRYEMYTAVAIAAVVFALTTLFSSKFDIVFGGKFVISHTLLDLLGLCFLASHRFWSIGIQEMQEKKMIRKLMEQQMQQCQALSANIDLVNRKYHDLKHVIQVMNSENRQEFLDQMEIEICNYEAFGNSGNKILDTVISNVCLQCQKQQISINLVLDGALLDPMDAVDICTIFGNALDNAVESVRKITEPEKRLIHVSLYEKQGFINICFENVSREPLTIREGQLVTSKKDPSYHGIGLKSIRYTAEKYGGVMTFQQKDGWFVLNLLFPSPLKKRNES